MSRKKRIQVPGLIHHVMARGNGRMRIFLDDVDCRKFLFVLGDVVDAFNVECCDYCVMPTHYHLSLRPRKPNLSEAIRQLNGVYAMWWNEVHATVGHVFQGRFKSQVVQREGYLLALCRYIALNPVRAGLVEQPEYWQWSSYGAMAGLCRNPGFLTTDPVLGQFGDGDVALLRNLYRQHIFAVLPDEGEMERLRSKQRVVGDRSFKHEILRQRAALESVPMGGDRADPAAAAPTPEDPSDSPLPVATRSPT
jgi:REP element-mobilizing transposase RayT